VTRELKSRFVFNVKLLRQKKEASDQAAYRHSFVTVVTGPWDPNSTHPKVHKYHAVCSNRNGARRMRKGNLLKKIYCVSV